MLEPSCKVVVQSIYATNVSYRRTGKKVQRDRPHHQVLRVTRSFEDQPSQRWRAALYNTDADVVYLNRIAELKELDFSLSEIRTIILMGSEDATGQKRRNELLRQYRSKLSEALERQAAIEKRVGDLSWHIQQLETNDDFQQCPGLMCKSCTFKDRCRFREL